MTALDVRGWVEHLLHARATLRTLDLYERLGLPEDEDIDSNTVNGLVQEKTCHLPKVGDHFTLDNFNGVVTRTAKRRVTEVRFTPIPAPAEKEDDHDREKWLPSRHLQNHN